VKSIRDVVAWLVEKIRLGKWLPDSLMSFFGKMFPRNFRAGVYVEVGMSWEGIEQTSQKPVRPKSQCLRRIMVPEKDQKDILDGLVNKQDTWEIVHITLRWL